MNSYEYIMYDQGWASVDIFQDRLKAMTAYQGLNATMHSLYISAYTPHLFCKSYFNIKVKICMQNIWIKPKTYFIIKELKYQVMEYEYLSQNKDVRKLFKGFVLLLAILQTCPWTMITHFIFYFIC